MSWRRWAVVALSFAASVGVSFYIVASTWPRERGWAFLPPWAHLLLLSAVALEIITRSWKIQLSAAALRIPLRFGDAARASLGGDFGAAITPARSGAEPARFLILATAGVPAASALLLIFAELFLEMLSLVVVVTLLAVLFQGSGTTLTGVIGLVGGYAALVLGVGVAGYALARHNAIGPPPCWAARLGLHAGRWRRLQRHLRQLRTSITGLRHARLGMVALSLGASVLHVLMRLTVLPIIVYAFGVRAPLAPLVLWPLALFYGGVVAPVPGGGGFIEIVFRQALGGVIPRAIFGVSLIWWRFYTFYLYVTLGALAAGRTVMQALRADGEREEESAVVARVGVGR